MVAFAANSLLCRLALRSADMDAASFTSIRLVAGAVTLWFLLQLRRAGSRPTGDWASALALFVYAAAFSFAYARLSAAVGALILFGAVQATMIGYGLFTGERLRPRQVLGLGLAGGGFVWLLLPGLSTPPMGGAAPMGVAGMAWAAYSLRGRGAADAIAATAGNFLRAVPFAAGLNAALFAGISWHAAEVWCAVASGAVTSGMGYVVWYTVLPRLRATDAAIVQLSVPVLAAAGGIGLLGEPPTLRLLLSATAILGGIAVVITARR